MTYVFRGADLWYRHPRPKDVEFIFDCFEQWPADHAGEYSIGRAINDCNRWLRLSKHVERPLVAESVGEETFIGCLVQDNIETPVALSRMLYSGLEVELASWVVHPEHQGNGYMSAMRRDFQAYCFEVMDAAEATFSAFVTSPAVMSQLGSGKIATDRGRVAAEQTNTGIELAKGRVTLAGRDSFKSANPSEVATFKWLGAKPRGKTPPDR